MHVNPEGQSDWITIKFNKFCTRERKFQYDDGEYLGYAIERD